MQVNIKRIKAKNRVATNPSLPVSIQALNNNGTPEHLQLEPEVLHVLAPPFVSRLPAERKAVRSHGKKRCSFIRKKREQTPSQGLLCYSACQVWYFYLPVILVSLQTCCSPRGFCFVPDVIVPMLSPLTTKPLIFLQVEEQTEEE